MIRTFQIDEPICLFSLKEFHRETQNDNTV